MIKEDLCSRPLVKAYQAVPGRTLSLQRKMIATSAKSIYEKAESADRTGIGLMLKQHMKTGGWQRRFPAWRAMRESSAEGFE